MALPLMAACLLNLFRTGALLLPLLMLGANVPLENKIAIFFHFYIAMKCKQIK